MNLIHAGLGLLLASIAALPGGARATPPGGDVPSLKREYLVCARETSLRRVDAGDMRRCAEVGQALLQRGFGGDFERLIAWWHAARNDDVRDRGVAGVAAHPAAGHDARAGEP